MAVANISGYDKKGTACFKKCKQLYEYQQLCLLRDIWWSSSNLHLNVVHFSTPVLIRHMWQLKTVVILHWCLIRAAAFIDIESLKIDCLRFVVCPLLPPDFQG